MDDEEIEKFCSDDLSSKPLMVNEPWLFVGPEEGQKDLLVKNQMMKKPSQWCKFRGWQGWDKDENKKFILIRNMSDVLILSRNDVPS